MHNLISNAVKCTPSGGRISVEAAIDDDRALHLTVSDTGVGIAPEDQERIFQPFQQIDNAVSRHLHGTGLGLAVVQQLVRLHAGRAWVESTPGEGSAFHVVLPEALPPVAELEEIIPVDGAVSPRGGSNGQDILFRDRRSRLSVLAVEDTPAHLSMMRLAVTSRGYTMHGVGSGEEALAWLAQPDNRPDVILLDMQLPGLDGFEVAARVKEQVETHAIPVIAVTADALSVNEERALASGCDAYLTKPIDIAKLLATIETVTA
jgi:CheY-like chemotaxis protein